jgi:hypothetical protein
MTRNEWVGVMLATGGILLGTGTLTIPSLAGMILVGAGVALGISGKATAAPASPRLRERTGEPSSAYQQTQPTRSQSLQARGSDRGAGGAL